ncbi:MAG TPA: TlpA disulfide reductase family protein [Pyrinomonadaceae bacterium]|nr:TlpA disulfide reductase family protein [Pyrinomonadaceae bacterium]
MRLLTVFFVLLCGIATFAQSGRVAPEAVAAPEQTVKQMYDEASSYVKTKAAEFDAKKVPYSDKLLEDTRKEQRSLAARYAAAAELRKDLSPDDRYYIGMLHWLATNLDGTIDNLAKFLAAADIDPSRAQSARYTSAVSLAKKGNTDAAEKMLAEYLAKTPVKASEEWRITVELAKAYDAKGDPARMAPLAEKALNSSIVLLKEPQTALTLDHVLDVGMLAFTAYSELGQRDKADAALDTLKSVAIDKASPSLYFYAMDHKLRYLIDTGRKDQATALYQSSLVDLTRDLKDKSKQADADRRFRERETAYRLLGGPSIELPPMQWVSGNARTLASMKGKVVLLDFWAMWCLPCVEALPELRQWSGEFKDQGFEILGLTRYYGSNYGYPADQAAELALIRSFATQRQLPYDIVVGDGQAAQLQYGAMLLPTAVLIDRKGIVRYVATGTNPSRMSEIRAMIVKLLAEK